jgi:hypothetical protein
MPPSNTPSNPIQHVVIMVQENHTVDNYFRSLAPWGANVASGWPVAANPLPNDLPHDRRSYFRWLSGKVTKRQHVQFDAAQLLPYYLYLAVTGAFLENHCAGFGTNSTANHLLIVGGQSPTLRNKPKSNTSPPWDTVPWDMPSLPGLADDNGVSWRCYTDNSFGDHYPAGYYTQLHGSPNVLESNDFMTDVQAGNLQTLSMLWHASPNDEHPPSDVRVGMNTIWQAVDAVVQAGMWDHTVFMLTYDDWGGFDDHVKTPVVEYTPDNVQLAYGSRVPLLMFGGRVRVGIDSRWCSHVSIPKTAMQLLGLPALGVPRVDNDGGLADLVDLSDKAKLNAAPPPFNTPNILGLLPPSPNPQPQPNPLPPPPINAPIPVGPVLLRNGQQLPAPFDVKLPKQPNPPKN